MLSQSATQSKTAKNQEEFSVLLKNKDISESISGTIKLEKQCNISKDHQDEYDQNISLYMSSQEYPTKSLESYEDLFKELNEYKNETLKKKVKNQKINIPEKNKVRLKTLIEKALTNETINNSKKSRENMKKDILYNMLNNSTNPIQVVDQIFKYNPDRNKISPNDSKFIFNEPLKENGKTLLYLACQEGNALFVQYFLNKKLNYNIPSKLENSEETPLECACRWNYLQIVNILLNQCNFNKKDICNASRCTCSKPILHLLKNYITKLDSKNNIFCFCK